MYITKAKINQHSIIIIIIIVVVIICPK